MQTEIAYWAFTDKPQCANQSVMPEYLNKDSRFVSFIKNLNYRRPKKYHVHGRQEKRTSPH